MKTKMQLSELFLNRYLYKEGQDTATQDSTYVSSNQTTPQSFVSAGAGAVDVNTGNVTINGGMITAFSVTANQIAANTITAAQIAAGSITATQIAAHTITSNEILANTLTVGTNVLIGSALGAGQAANDVNSNSTLIQGGKITTNSIVANQLNVSTLSSITADLGTITAGSITFAQTTDPGAKLKWFGGSRIWEDSSSDMGINAIGNQLYIYCASNQVALFQSGGKTQFFTDTSFQNTVYYSSGNNTYVWGNDNTNLMLGALSYIYFKIGGYPGSEQMKLSSVGLTLQGYLYQPNSAIIVHGGGAGITSTLPATSGTLKNAILPTSEGFNALACMESPEVWFMDFCKEKGKLDPMFEEVTFPPYHYIKCEDGEYQVWGKRKGHDHVRFESKTSEEFLANERFLQMSKPSY